MKKRILIYAMALVLMIPGVLLASCAKSEPALTAEEIVTAATEAIDELYSYRYDSVSQWSGPIEGELNTLMVEMSGVRHEEIEEMHDNINVLFEAPPDSSGQQSFERYIMDHRLYYWSSESGSWSSSEYEENYWNAWAIANQQADLLTGLSPVILLDTETIDGIECYKLQLEADEEKVWNWVTAQTFSQFLESWDCSKNLVTDYSAFLWISQDKFFPVKTVIDVTMMDGEDTITYANTVLINQLNEPLNLELPTEALEK